MTESEVRETCRESIVETLAPFGDAEATAEVTARVEALPCDGDIHAFANKIAAVATAVWQRKIAETEQRINRLREQAAMLSTMHLLPKSLRTH